MLATVIVISTPDLATAQARRSPDRLAVYEEWWPLPGTRAPKMLRASLAPAKVEEGAGGRRARGSRRSKGCGPSRLPGHLCKASPLSRGALFTECSCRDLGCLREGGTGVVGEVVHTSIFSTSLYSGLTIQLPGHTPAKGTLPSEGTCPELP